MGAGDALGGSQALTAAVALRPADPRIWADLSGAFGGLGQRAEAERCAKESVRLDPCQSAVWLQLGSIRNAAGDMDASVDAYERALSLDRGLVDAWIGLGLAHLSAKRFRKAIAPFEEAVARGMAENAAIQGCLGEALYSSGAFEQSGAAFEIACRVQPENVVFAHKLARARFILDVMDGSAQEAVATYERRGGTTEDIEKTLRDGFQVLGSFGYGDAAIRLGEVLLARDPTDAMQAYLLATLRGEAMDRAPDRYIISFFDRFAKDFDRQLVDVLEYKVPTALAHMTEEFLVQTQRRVSRVLDLGCGTGLAGMPLARPGRTLTGVDLSPRMLDEARRLGCYDVLVESELVTFLSGGLHDYDLIVAADVLIYFGNLSPLLQGAARGLSTGGVFAFSIETAQCDIAHLPSGRFAHGLDYLERESISAGFTIVEIRGAAIRLERDGHAMGALVLLTRTS